jgi:SAM-dependent methyltransferase
MAKTDPFDKNVEQFEKWFENNRYVYRSELEALKYFVPGKKRGVEIGIGTGLFAKPLGVKEGIEPSLAMAERAREKGLNVQIGVAEDLPFGDRGFDFALMVTTVCFLDDVEKGFWQVYRILKPGGLFIIGLIDRDSRQGQRYLKNKDSSTFYKIAEFYSTSQVLQILDRTGFKNPDVIQTVFGDLKEINTVQPFEQGHGKGGFVVIKAAKGVNHD